MSSPEFTVQTVFNKFSIIRQIGKGSFGTVYLGINNKTNEKVGIKTEIQTKKQHLSLLESECQKLNTLKNIIGIPKIYEYGKIEGFNILVMELLGKSLNDLFQSQHRKFSLKTVCTLGIDMLKIIQHVHERKLIHRDIKPDNYMMGRESLKDILYLIDFGLAKKYILNNGQHIPYKSGKNITGTARYCSIYTHLGIEQSRRDDLESIGYVLIYFLRGNLPWQGIKTKCNDKHYEKIGFVKQSTSIEVLCSDFPNEFCNYFNYVKQLEFEEDPNYNMLIELFERTLKKSCGTKYINNGICNGNRHNLFDWNSMGYKLESPRRNNKKKKESTVFSSPKRRSSIVNNGCNSDSDIKDNSFIGNNNNYFNEKENDDDDDNKETSRNDGKKKIRFKNKDNEVHCKCFIF